MKGCFPPGRAGTLPVDRRELRCDRSNPCSNAATGREQPRNDLARCRRSPAA